MKIFLKERGLELSDDKTLITHITDGFDFLGWNCRKIRGKLLIKPSKASIQKFVKNVSQTIKTRKSWPQGLLISKMNPIIRGWTNYHRSVVSSEIFHKLDNIIWEMLWKWAKRRHPNKSRVWIAKKYWKQSRTRRWNFQTENNRLLFLSDTKIQRHISLKLQMNPFLDNDYFNERRSKLRFRKGMPH